MSGQYYEGIGRRKEATARVRIMSGSGRFIVNDKPLEKYFTRLGDIDTIFAPLRVTGENPSALDVSVKVRGGGVSGQTGAVQLGLARALVLMNPEYRKVLREGGFLTVDARVKERKKPGLKRARKAPTYTKR
ncbi:MAG: 30S ribosomal protein S9 [Anaerolineales bacterium]|nr:30S ribosomal protein S9 [Anaerolineales bacterium]MCS7249059.1 30S ribosomal protein S9 [Anaerolineales bacterium]MDW8162872.1 30S ribosomal protein S9 [Anaerolineales bacterium]MDW8446841.1 30S ribosomal protein S9 [Anaerolineales bacterium]